MWSTAIPAEIAAWVDGSMPQRAETVQGYVQGMHQGWLVDMATHRLGQKVISPATMGLAIATIPTS